MNKKIEALQSKIEELKQKQKEEAQKAKNKEIKQRIEENATPEFFETIQEISRVKDWYAANPITVEITVTCKITSFFNPDNDYIRYEISDVNCPDIINSKEITRVVYRSLKSDRSMWEAPPEDVITDLVEKAVGQLKIKYGRAFYDVCDYISIIKRERHNSRF